MISISKCSNINIERHGFKTIFTFFDGYLTIVIHKPLLDSDITIHNKLNAYIEKLQQKNIIYYCSRTDYCLHQKKIREKNYVSCGKCKFLKPKEVN